jgi:hypothetical protein
MTTAQESSERAAITRADARSDSRASVSREGPKRALLSTSWRKPNNRCLGCELMSHCVSSRILAATANQTQ